MLMLFLFFFNLYNSSNNKETKEQPAELASTYCKDCLRVFDVRFKVDVLIDVVKMRHSSILIRSLTLNLRPQGDLVKAAWSFPSGD